MIIQRTFCSRLSISRLFIGNPTWMQITDHATVSLLFIYWSISYQRHTRILAWLVQLNIVIHFLIDWLFPCLPLQTLHFDPPQTRTSHVTSRTSQEREWVILREAENQWKAAAWWRLNHTPVTTKARITFAFEVWMQHWTSYVSGVWQIITVHWHYRQNALDCWISRRGSKACKNLEDFLENRDLVAQGPPLSHKSALHSNYVK